MVALDFSVHESLDHPLFTLGLAAWNRSLSLSMLRTVLLGTMRSTGTIMLIIVAAYFLNFVMSATGLTTRLTDTVQGLGLSKMEMLLALVMQAMGFDMVWSGIVVVLLVEVALITPPVGLNLFVVHNIRKGGSMNDVIMGSLPFLAAMFALLLLLAVFPGLALWLPSVAG